MAGEMCVCVCVCLQIDDSLSAEAVERACSAGTSSSLLSTLNFQVSIATMYFSNAKVDAFFVLSAMHHFDDETIQEGRDIITAGTQRLTFEPSHCFLLGLSFFLRYEVSN